MRFLSGLLVLVAAVGVQAAQETGFRFTDIAGGRPTTYRDGDALTARFGAPQGMAFDQAGNLYVADTGNLCIRKVTPDGIVSTYAGAPNPFQEAVDGPSSVARFRNPISLAFDAAGNLLVGDNTAVRRISPQGVVTTVASGLVLTQGIAVGRDGTIYVSEGGYGTIRRIGSDGRVETFAGSYGNPGRADGVGGEARFGWAGDLVFDARGQLWVADGNNNAIRRIAPDGNVTTVVTLDGVNGLALDPAGTLYATSFQYPAVWKIVGERAVAIAGGTSTLLSGGTTNHLVGHIDGPLGVGQLGRPSRIAVSAAGEVYVSDGSIRRIRPDGMLTTFAGLSAPATGAEGLGAAARFVAPNAVAVDAAGNCYVSDDGAHVVWKVTPEGRSSVLAGSPGRAGSRNGRGREALFIDPGAIAIGPDEAVYVMDFGGVRRISAEGEVTTHIGPGSARPGFTFYPGAGPLTFDAAGNLYVADTHQQVVRKITPGGTMSIVAGTMEQTGHVDGPALQARFNRPGGGIAVGQDGAIYISDTLNSAVRKIGADGIVSTLVKEYPEYPGSGFIGTPPGGLVVDEAGAVWVMFDRTLRRISAPGDVADMPGTPLALNEPLGTGIIVQSGSASYLRGLARQKDGTLFFIDPHNGTLVRAEQRPVSRLANLSVRAPAGVNDQTLIAGFAIRGGLSKRVLVRGVGPGLSAFGVESVVPDPALRVFDAAGALRGENEDWVDGDAMRATFASVGAFALSRGSRDAALAMELPPGGFSAHLVTAAAGAGMIELYDVEPGSPAQVTNLSARARVAPATGGVTAGFAIAGEVPKRVLIRGVGPGLRAVGVSGAMGAVRLRLINQAGQEVAWNDGWGGVKSFSDAFARVGAFPLGAFDRDAALLLQLPPGNYSVQMTNLDALAGTGLIEVYDADP